MSTLRRELSAGETLYRQGDPSDSAWLIESGRLALTAQHGRRVVSHGTLGAGEMMGELGMLDGAPRSATAIAIEDSVLLAVDSRQIAERLHASDPILQLLFDALLKRARAIMTVLPRELALPAEDAEDNVNQDQTGISKIRLEAQLREAIHNDALEVRYQPIHDLQQKRVTGYEALVRWQHPQLGAVSTSKFIKLAEETSLILPVGEYVLDKACALLAQLHAGGASSVSIAVNLSARQLVHSGMAEQIFARIERAGLTTGALKLEVTESQMLDYASVRTVMARCRAYGIPFALDDFGTGYSNLTHLHELDFDVVKIDRAFAANMYTSKRAMAIVQAIVAMAHGIDAEVVMEGVETEQQLAKLSAMGVRYAQGYLIGKAQSAQAVLDAVCSPG